jgi:hypothetical protein
MKEQGELCNILARNLFLNLHNGCFILTNAA